MKPKMKIRNLTPILSLGLAAIPAAHANWTLLENFEDGAFPEGTVITNSSALLGFDGEHRITTDPLDPENQVDRIVADVSSGITNIGNFLDFSFPLETPIADGSTVTFYHRIMVEGPVDENDADGPFGFLDVSYGFVDVEYDGEWAYGDFEAQFGYSILTDLNWTIRNADETGQYAPWSPIWQNVNPLTDLNVWYELWLVIDHASDTSDVYIKGGQFTEQTLAVENARFRNGGSTDPFKYFVMKSHNGNEDTEAGYRGIDPWYLDDLYIDYTGENLSTPSGGESVTWNGFPVDANGWADTGSWMGVVNVTHDPYIWNVDLGKYVYIADGSSWIYVYK
jgi:hypothetical protein